MVHDDDKKLEIDEQFTGFEDLTLEGEIVDEPTIAESAPIELAQDEGINSHNEENANQLPVQFSPEKAKEQKPAGQELKTYAGGLTLNDSDAEETHTKKGRIGDRLVSMGIITEDQLNVALQEKKISGKLLGEVLVDLGFIDEDTLTAFLAESSGFELFDAQHTIFDGEVLGLIDKATAAKHKVLPVSISDTDIRVAMADPYDVVALDILRRFVPKGLQIKPMVCTPKTLSDAIDAAYGYASSV